MRVTRSWQTWKRKHLENGQRNDEGYGGLLGIVDYVLRSSGFLGLAWGRELRHIYERCIAGVEDTPVIQASWHSASARTSSTSSLGECNQLSAIHFFGAWCLVPGDLSLYIYMSLSMYDNSDLFNTRLYLCFRGAKPGAAGRVPRVLLPRVQHCM